MQSKPQILLLCYPQRLLLPAKSSSSSSLVQPMAFAVATGGGGAGILCGNTTTGTPCTPLSQSHIAFPSSSSTRRRNLHLVSAKKLSSRSRRNLPTTTTTDQEPQPTPEIADDNPPFPELPGSEPDFFEGPQWDTVGFVGEYIWVLGVVFAIIAALYAAINYNLGASDFKETAAYKESVQSQELLGQPEESESDVFESNPTEVAPSLE